MFSQVFVEAMEANAKAGKSLFDLQRTMTPMLKSKSGNDQLTVGRGDPNAQATVFVPNIKKRGAGGRRNATSGSAQKRFKCDQPGCKEWSKSNQALKVHKKRQHKKGAQ